jgi:hypothetical protein
MNVQITMELEIALLVKNSNLIEAIIVNFAINAFLKWTIIVLG